MGRELIASAKPNEHKVVVMNRVFPYSRIRKMVLSDDKCFVKMMHQVAKVVLRETKERWRLIQGGSDE